MELKTLERHPQLSLATRGEDWVTRVAGGPPLRLCGLGPWGAGMQPLPAGRTGSPKLRVAQQLGPWRPGPGDLPAPPSPPAAHQSITGPVQRQGEGRQTSGAQDGSGPGRREGIASLTAVSHGVTWCATFLGTHPRVSPTHPDWVSLLSVPIAPCAYLHNTTTLTV